MTLGKLAKKFNVNREAVRFYERQGLLPEPIRNESGYRLYDEQAEKALAFILNSKDLGFTLIEIKSLLSLRIVNGENCKIIRARAQDKLTDIDDKIKHLEKLKKSLKILINSCIKRQTSSYCPILDNLEN